MRVLGSKSNEIVAVHLIKSFCLPTLSYGCEIWHARAADVRSASVAWNNGFRKIFNTCWRESVKPLQFSAHAYLYLSSFISADYFTGRSVCFRTIWLYRLWL